MKWTLLLLLSACATSSGDTYKTRCGVGPAMDFYTGELIKESWIGVDALQWAEDEILWYLERHAKDPRLYNRKVACGTLTQLKVFVHPTWKWGTPGSEVSGVAMCHMRYIEIGTPEDLKWTSTALTHELVHVMQDCKPVRPAEDGLDNDHANWERDGIFDAIRATWTP